MINDIVISKYTAENIIKHNKLSIGYYQAILDTCNILDKEEQYNLKTMIRNLEKINLDLLIAFEE